MKNFAILTLAAASLLLPGCGILNPLALPSAVAQNSNFSFKGKVVTASGQSVDGVIVTLTNSHHVWAPLSGARDLPDVITRRVDGRFGYDARGSSCDFLFSKDGYFDVDYRFTAGHNDEIQTDDGTWGNTENFPVVLLSNRTPDAPLLHLSHNISYENYPVADSISLPNMATGGNTGDVFYAGKNAEDPSLFPVGTLYLTLDKQPPTALNDKGDIDLAELDIPHHVTLHLLGNDAGFIPIAPRIGFPPLKTSDAAPTSGYAHELTFTRVRLKEMRAATPDRIIEAHEYFYFHAGRYYGKGVFSWAVRSGKPNFEYNLYIQPEPGNPDLTLRSLSR